MTILFVSKNGFAKGLCFFVRLSDQRNSMPTISQLVGKAVRNSGARILRRRCRVVHRKEVFALALHFDS
jgi:hypothetical protein